MPEYIELKHRMPADREPLPGAVRVTWPHPDWAEEAQECDGEILMQGAWWPAPGDSANPNMLTARLTSAVDLVLYPNGVVMAEPETPLIQLRIGYRNPTYLDVSLADATALSEALRQLVATAKAA